MPEGSPLSKIILLVILILLNALFAMSEIAVISLNDNKLKLLAQKGNKKAQILVRLTKEPSKFLATIQVGVTLSGLLSSAVAADTFTDYVVYAFRNTAIAENVIRMISLVGITMILAYINLVFGELVPKRIAMNNPEKISFAVSGVLRVTSIITRPFVTLLSASTNGVLRLLGIDPNKEESDVTEEEIRMMIDVGEEDGTIRESEREMLHNVFEFDERTADEIMTHRTEMVGLDVSASLQEIIDIAVTNGRSRLPVFEQSIDKIVGILNIKDLLGFIVRRPESFDLRQHMRPVMHVPESMLCKNLFEEFRLRHVQMAVIVDEYGGTSGIVTMEDILESIVGNIQDEYDDEAESIRQVADGEFLLEGTAPLDEIADALVIRFGSDLDCETIAGFITERLGHLPEPGEAIEFGGYTLAVLDVSEHRVTGVRAKRIEHKQGS